MQLSIFFLDSCFFYVIIWHVMLEETFDISVLYDFYGPLLTEKQQRFVDLYHNENCSLTEIAEETGVSKQAVSEGLKRAEKALMNYEEKLGLAARWKREHGI